MKNKTVKTTSIEICATCKFFERNQAFPNRYGKCVHPRHPTADHYVTEKVHDSFGCIHWIKLEVV